MKRKYILALAIIFIATFPYILYHNTEDYNFVQDRWIPCLDYLEQGTLYGNQPLCIQAPLTYLTLYPFTVFGDYFNLAVTIFVFLLISLIFVFGNKIIKKESGKESLIIYTLLFCLIFLYSLLGAFASLLGTTFFFFAVYILFYTRLKHKMLYVGILFALSIFSKLSHAIFIFVIILYYAFFELKILKKFNYQKLKPLIPLLIPTIVLFIIFKIIWLHFLIHVFSLAYATFFSFTSPQIQTGISTQILKMIFSFNPFRILIMFIIIFSIIFGGKKAITSIPSFGFLIIYIITLEQLSFRFYLPAFLFFSIILTIKLNSLNKKYIKYIIISIFLLLILFFAIKNTYLESNFNDIQLLTTGALKEIPIFEGEVFGNVPIKDLKSYGLNINSERYKFLPEYGLSFFEKPIGRVLEYYGVYNPKEWQNYISKFYTQYLNKILSKDYSLIIFSPRGHKTDLSIILKRAIQNNQLLEKYCLFKIPDFSKGINIEPAIYLFLKRDKTKCNIYHQIITDYYTRSLPKLCSKSSVAGLLTKIVLSTTQDYQIFENLECKSKKSDFLLKYFNYKHSPGIYTNKRRINKDLIKKLFFSKQEEIDLDKVSECFTIITNNRKIVAGKICKDVGDCKKYFKDNRLYSCEKSEYKIDYPLKVCYSKEDCLKFYNIINKKHYINCVNNICMYLTSIDYRFVHPHKFPFPEISGFFLSPEIDFKNITLKIAEDYVLK